ncbi:MAG: ImmA/IrrE family metallo-endopeptidase [Leptospirales bacterium]|nr:ImmA/IrrE family metallo-endopeptidase [Leptospirales bacterium]
MPDFTITDEIIAKIAAQCGIDKYKVKTLNEFYKMFAVAMKQQYLAHVIRTMEEQLRKVSGNEMFRIVCSPVGESSKELGIASAQYFEKRYFAIYYHPNTDEKQLRVLLAHELGHLFLIEMLNSIEILNSNNNQHPYNEKTNTEPLATILGILTIFDKNEFYHNKTTPYKHTSPDAILQDFSLLKNRDNKRFNVS